MQIYKIKVIHKPRYYPKETLIKFPHYLFAIDMVSDKTEYQSCRRLTPSNILYLLLFHPLFHINDIMNAKLHIILLYERSAFDLPAFISTIHFAKLRQGIRYAGRLSQCGHHCRAGKILSENLVM